MQILIFIFYRLLEAANKFEIPDVQTRGQEISINRLTVAKILKKAKVIMKSTPLKKKKDEWQRRMFLNFGPARNTSTHFFQKWLMYY